MAHPWCDYERITEPMLYMYKSHMRSSLSKDSNIYHYVVVLFLFLESDFIEGIT